ncbi:MAG TPA: alkaline phosphatase family protein [Bryobacteraceae bacterium]|nr:alkaline phosphatase family protein [Bryobacteraceae bacterium]
MGRRLPTFIGEALLAGAIIGAGAAQAQTPAPTAGPATPIQHLVVIFQENVSFDHYFGTYPFAANPEGEPQFFPFASTPSVNGFSPAATSGFATLANTANGAGATPPFRLDRSQAATADQDHNYTPEQMAYHAGLLDLFPKDLGTPGAPPAGAPQDLTTGLVMGYYDGNTVTALWNYAQHYSMNDNSYGTTFGPSTPGALNLIAGQTNGVINNSNGTGALIGDGNGGLTDISDADPAGDVCSTSTGETFSMSGKNIGNLLSSAGVTWGFFSGGFDLTQTNPDGSTGCNRTTTSLITSTKKADYIPHHQPFQYYKSTANLTHSRPSSVAMIGQNGDGANHQYDINDFYAAVNAANFPAVSFLKAPGFEDGHAGYSDPIDEQQFIVHVINFLQNSPYWANTAVVISWDDSDGWYDHQMPPLVNQSATSADMITGVGACGSATAGLSTVASGNVVAQGRCGYGPRLPLLVISPYAKQNFVDHTVTDQSSILRFIEDNWFYGQRLGQGSFDAIAGPLDNMFDFGATPNTTKFVLSEVSGLPVDPTQSAKPDSLSHFHSVRPIENKSR